MAGEIDKIKLHMKTPGLADIFLKEIRAVEGFQVINTDAALRPDLLIFETGSDALNDLLLIESLLNEDKIGEFFLTSRSADPSLLMQAMRTGAKEFLLLPLKATEMQQALGRFKERRKQSRRDALPDKNGQIISIVGSKGGVGTTTVSVNLAINLAENKEVHSVALMDMNTLFGEIPLFLEITPKFHWGEITRNIERLDTAFLTNVLSRHASGVHVLPSPNYLNGHHSPTPEIMERLLELMRTMFDYVIIDIGQAMDESALKVLQMSDSLLLVSILSLPCLTTTNRLLRSFIDFGYIEQNRIKVVINRYTKKSEITISDAAVGIGKEPFWTIPNDYGTTMSAINNGKPVSQISPKSSIAKNFRELAGELAPYKAEKKKKGWFFGW